MPLRSHTAFRRLIVAGVAVLALGAAVFGASAANAAAQQGRSSQVVASVLDGLDAAVPVDGEAPADAASLPALNREGVDVVGRLQAESVSLDVPVAALGGDARLTPALANGREDELVVQGYAYQGQIGRIAEVPRGAAVTFTQMDGAVRRYVAVDTGELRGEFNDTFDLLVYYQDELGTKHWMGCVEAR